jgi:hypothetical protein
MSSSGVLTAHANWSEGRHLHYIRKQVSVELKSLDSKYDWTTNAVQPVEAFGIKGQLSVLAQLENYFLTYHCYAGPQKSYRSGYVISVYTTEYRHVFDHRIVQLLFGMADRLGLNEDFGEFEYVGKHPCRAANDD